MAGVLLLAAIGACGGDGGPVGPGADGAAHMTAKIDGQAWASDAQYLSGGVVVQTSGVYLLQGTKVLSSSSVISIQLALYNIDGPGTYPLGVGPSVVGGIGLVSEASAGWTTPLSGESGSITIDVLTATRISGHFAFSATPATGSATETREVTEGDFDLPVTIQGELAPLSDAAGSRVSADVGGAPWNAATVAVAMTSDHTLVVSALNTSYSMSMSLMQVTGPGTYPLSSIAPIRTLAVTGPADDPQGDHCCWGGSIIIGGDGTVSSADVGTVTITSLTPTRAVGSFSATLAPATGAATTASLTIANGTFDVGIPPHP